MAGTALDFFRRQRRRQKEQEHQSQASKWILGFSSYSNSLLLFDTSPPRGDQITCLDGIRFWSISWVVVSQCYIFAQLEMPIRNTVYINGEVS